MIRGYARLLALATVCLGLSVLLVRTPTRTRGADVIGVSAYSAADVVLLLGGLVAIVIAAVLVVRIMRRAEPGLSRLAQQQSEFLMSLPIRRVPWAVFGMAALSLFLELALIRWQSAVIPILAFYKNFSLIAAFAGLGLGYALARRTSIPSFVVVPLLMVQVVAQIVLHFLTGDTITSLQVNPVSEQWTMGLLQTQSALDLVAVYSVLAMVFLTTALVFIPIGQVTGRLMGRMEGLRAYGINLLGSLAGVGLMNVLSLLWSPPHVWFAIALAGLTPLFAFSRRLVVAFSVAGLLLIAVTALPGGMTSREFHSPYQLIESRSDPSGDLLVRAAGHFLLTARDLTPERVEADPTRKAEAAYYEFPFRLAEGARNALIVGAGAGNDVAAALRVGIPRIDAVEIDPVVAELGLHGHPEQPYSDDRVSLIVDDARSYLKGTAEEYDLIVYGLLDSHSVLSQGSSVRMDSFVYTVEGLRDARSRLSDTGTLSLSFLAFNDDMTEKLYSMLATVFDGRPPVVLDSEVEGIVTYLQGANRQVEVSPGTLVDADMVDITDRVSQLALGTEASTDDWPFFYMPRRVYPASYLGMVALILLLTLLMVREFLAEKLDLANAGFFFLGAGFLLIETKGITELGLAFGNTWQVIGLVISGVLVMAFLANWVVSRIPRVNLGVVFALLMVSLGIGFVVSRSGGLQAGGPGRWLALAALTLPVFFSGMAFSSGLKAAGSISAVMAANLTGSVAGGLLEYNSMGFGFQALYLVAAVVYGLAAVSFLLWRRSEAGPAEEIVEPIEVIRR